jgi:GDP-L-fucose synthase
MAPTETSFSLAGRRVWVAGHRGLVGSAIQRRLAREDCDVLNVDRSGVDLRRQADVEAWMADQRPDVVVVAAAKVGGILANSTRPAEFIYDNLAIEANIIEGARRVSVAKLVFLGSACIYPKLAPQPMPETAMLTGPLEPTNEWYAIAKIAGIKMCQAYRAQYGLDFISAMPTNLYGPGDNFDLASGHVLPALLRKVHEAKTAGEKTVEIWGSGKPLREFLYVDDCADAVVFLLKHYSGNEHVNVGSGEETSIAALARTIAEVIGYTGKFHYDKSKPDGMPRKLLDVAKLTAMGWRARTGLADGIRWTYDWYLKNRDGKSG